MPWARRICFGLGWVAFIGFAAPLSAAEPDAAGIEFFERKLRPLLAENCFSCHGAEKQKGHLRLDSPADMPLEPSDHVGDFVFARRGNTGRRHVEEDEVVVVGEAHHEARRAHRRVVEKLADGGGGRL